MTEPQIKSDPLYLLLRNGEIEEFNRRVASGETYDLTHCDFRRADLRGLVADGLDFSGSYFRQADLRGIDFSRSRLEGSSIHGAHIAGVYFPSELRPEEISLSLLYGTRMRYLKAD
ncbi:pentapeptide repeat protein [Nitrosococcus halophilus Nc 4]|uniref:Pentapeptide repeat protein n=1 Tax=Nitrosococcus halophilus (strain Nc4) TaxID=472759 RepID=D5C479_NITHN|nr:pentapeptide repeat-containing protein [Nitrosococcus halophilus]ADE13267.1 pentapeptide repeat protein [Nitrosococcus halophilus Nc 4]